MSGISTGPGAGEALAAAAIEALRGVAGLNAVHEGEPLQASCPFASVEAGPEADWSHKSGEGRELRLAVTIRDKGERPARLRTLLSEVEAALDGGLAVPSGWRVVTMVFRRARLVQARAGEWAGVIEYRVRLLAEPG